MLNAFVVRFARFMVRSLLAAAFVLAIAAISIVFRYPDAYRPEILAVAAAALAVIPATFATWSTQRMLEIQEDANAPFPYPSFDARSRYQVMQLRIENYGKGIAKNIYLEWTGEKVLEAPEGGPPKYLSKSSPLPVLLPERNESFYVDVAQQFATKYGHADFSGIVHFRDGKGRRQSHSFILAASHLEESLLADTETLKTNFELQRIPSELEKIKQVLEKLSKITPAP
jgi:hypothetical protein